MEWFSRQKKQRAVSPMSAEEAIPLTSRDDTHDSIDEEWDVELDMDLDIASRNSKWRRVRTVWVWTKYLASLPLPRLFVHTPRSDNPEVVGHLEGLRAYAAFCILHSAVSTQTQTASDEDRSVFSWLPTAQASSAVFFVISGYALSRSIMTSDDLPTTYRKLASSILRRWFRLYLPFLLVTCLTLPAVYLQLIPASSQAYMAKAQPTFLLQLQDWLRSIWTASNPFSALNWHRMTDPAPSYGPQFAMLPFLFRGSLVLFANILLTAAMRDQLYRVLFALYHITILLNLFSAPVPALFLSGHILAQLNRTAGQPLPPPPPPTMMTTTTTTLPISQPQPPPAGPSSPSSRPSPPVVSPPQTRPTTYRAATLRHLATLLRPLEANTPCLLPDPKTFLLLLLLACSVFALSELASFPVFPPQAEEGGDKSLVSPSWRVPGTWVATRRPGGGSGSGYVSLLLPGLGAVGMLFCTERIVGLRDLLGSRAGREAGRLATGAFWGAAVVGVAMRMIHDVLGLRGGVLWVALGLVVVVVGDWGSRMEGWVLDMVRRVDARVTPAFIAYLVSLASVS